MEGSTISIFAALAGNVAVAVVKFASWGVSGSSAMFTEAIHSLVDSANQVLLLIGNSRGRRPADDHHPFGHGLEVYFWTFIVALMIFAVGGAVGIYEGLDKLAHPKPMDHVWLNLGVIAISALLEGLSLVTGLRASRRTRSQVVRKVLPSLNFLEVMHYSKDPGIYEVLAEDAAAILGLVLAAAGVIGAAWLGWPRADAYASIGIGALLIAVAGFLVLETKSLLAGEAAAPMVVDAIRDILEGDRRVSHVCEVRSMHMGPQDILVAATLDFGDTLTARELEIAADEMTQAIKKAEPRVTSVFIRPGQAAVNDPAPHKAVEGRRSPVRAGPRRSARAQRP
jgi:cation diffusion facilitator family transporter